MKKWLFVLLVLSGCGRFPQPAQEPVQQSSSEEEEKSTPPAVIEPQAFVVLADGKEVHIPLFPVDAPEADQSPACILSFPESEKTYDLETAVVHSLVFKGLYPSDATYDALVIRPMDPFPQWLDWLAAKGLPYNFTEQYDGPLSGFSDRNTVHVACHPQACGGSQWEKQILYVYRSDAPICRMIGSYYIELPFETETDAWAWFDAFAQIL